MAADEMRVIPEATPATPDLICWLWAAFPAHDGRLPVRVIADALEVSQTTIRRWIRDAADLELNHAGLVRLKQRAILRGKGTYLWPPLDEATLFRNDAQLRQAIRAQRLIDTQPGQVPKEWHADGTIDPRLVHLVHYPAAHAYGIATSTTAKTEQRIRRTGTILRTTKAATKHQAVIIRELTLRTKTPHRCIVPKALAPAGHTNTWHETAGPTARFRRTPPPPADLRERT